MKRTRMLAVGVVLTGFAAWPSAGATAVRWFHSPSGNISCEVASGGGRGTYAFCQTGKPARSATIKANGRTQICRGVRCLGNGPVDAVTLQYGASIRVGPFRCTSRRDGMRCVVVTSGHGFQMSRESLRLF